MQHSHRSMVVWCVLLLAGFANWGQTEPVQGGRSPQQNPAVTQARYPSSARPASAAGDAGHLNREFAALRADLEAALESQRNLVARIIALEQENQAQNAQIQQLQNLVSAMDQRFGDAEKGWRAKMEELNATVVREREQRRREQEALLKGVSSEIERSSRRTAGTEPGNYKTLVVQKGDTLGAIAKISGVSVEELRRVNGLKNDNIFIGQTLKIPVK